MPGVIVRKVAQDVYAVRVGDNKILDRDHIQLCPRASDPSGRPVTFEFTAGDPDSDDEGEDDDFTAERILMDKPDPGTPGGRLYKVRWKGFAASRNSGELRAALFQGILRSGLIIQGKGTFLWMSGTCWSIWWLQQHRDGSTLALLFVLVLGRQVRALMQGFVGLDWSYILFT